MRPNGFENSLAALGPQGAELIGALMEAAGDALVLMDADRRILMLNAAARAMFGYQDQDIVGEGCTLLFADQADFEQTLPEGAPPATASLRVAFRRASGARFSGETLVNRVALASARGTAWVMQIRDVNAPTPRDRANAQRDARATEVFRHAAEGIIISDSDNCIIDVNPAFTRITKYAREDALGQTPAQLLNSGVQDKSFYQQLWKQLLTTGHWRGELWNKRKDGKHYLEWLSLSLVRDQQGKVINHIAIFSDITEIRRSQDEINRLTRYDAVTNLPNLLYLREHLELALKASAANENPLALMILNLDGFQRIVSGFGHSGADSVLRAVAEGIARTVPERSTIARTGGDSFAVVGEPNREGFLLSAQARDLQALLHNQIRVPEHGQIDLSCCIGIALYPDDADTAEDLLRNAEAALHRAKSSGPGNIAYYRPEITQAATKRLTLEADLNRALDQDELVLFYQPKLCLRTGLIIGSEALIRWQRPDGVLLAPAEFMPVVESSDLVFDVGRGVLEQAARDCIALHEAGLDSGQVGVNVSSALITSGDLPQMLKEVCTFFGIKPSCLEIEVLENVFFDDPQHVLRVLEAVKSLGARIALDDFGTGFSSLGYLKRFPIDVLKIDRSFVKDMAVDAGDMAIVRSTIQMAHSLGIDALAEGIENDDAIKRLVALGCDAAQGYGIGRPAPLEQLIKRLEEVRDRGPDPRVRNLINRQVLIVSEDAEQRETLRGVLEDLGWAVSIAETHAQAMDIFNAEPLCMLITDHAPQHLDGISLLEQTRGPRPDLIRVLCAEIDDPAIIIDAINRGGIVRHLPRQWTREDVAQVSEVAGSLSQLVRQAARTDKTQLGS